MQLKSLIFILVFLFSYAAQSQSLQIFDIDTTDFPTMRAKFYAIDKDGKQIRPTISELQLKEDGIERVITNISCPAIKPPKRLSVGIMVDTYNNIDLARKGTERLINFLNSNKDEIAITYMDKAALIYQDFTGNKIKAIDKATTIPKAPGYANVNAMFNSPYTGGIPFIKDREAEKKVLILITDLHCPNLTIDEEQLIADAKANNIAIYSVLLHTNDYTGLFNRIANATGAKVFEKVKNENQISNIFAEIPNTEHYDPCTIEWESGVYCQKNDIKLELLMNELITSTEYSISQNKISKLEFTPYSSRFINPIIGVKTTQNISVYALNSNFKVKNIRSSNPNYSITPSNFNLDKNQSQELEISYTAIDSGYTFAEFIIETDQCDLKYFAIGGYANIKNKKNTIKVLKPNGGENFVAGTDSIIQWDGIAETDLVKIEYSIDNGKTWKHIDTARNNIYLWKNIPLPRSSNCLIKVNHLEQNLSKDTLGQLIKSIKGGNLEILSISFSPDGPIIASSGNGDYNVKLWNVETGNQLANLQGHTYFISSLAFSPDGKYIASASGDWSIKIWNASTYKLVRTLTGHKNNASSVTFSSDSKFIATGGWDNVVKFWDVENGTLIKTFTGHNNSINSVSFSPDYKFLAAGSYSSLKIWEVDSGIELININTYCEKISFTKDGSKVVVAGGNSIKTVSVFDGNIVHNINNISSRSKDCMALSPDESTVASGSWNDFVFLWDVYSKKAKHTIYDKNLYVNAMEYSSNGKYLATGSVYSYIKIWAMLGGVFQSDQSDSVFSIIAPEPRFDKLNIDMGRVIVNGMKDTLVTAVFCNQGDAPLHVLGVDVTNGDVSEFQVPRGAGEFYLEAGECRDLMFEFLPNKVGNRQAKVTVRTTIGDFRDTISIVGEGVQPKLQLLTDFVDFGVKEIYTEKDSTIVLIKNLSNFPITIDSVASIGPDTTQFKIQSSLSSFTLLANESKSMDIKFLPKYNGRTSGRIAFYYNQVGSPSITQLYGAGLGAVATLSKDSAYPGQKISHILVLQNTNPKILSEFVSRVEGIARFESSILAPIRQSEILKNQNDSTYIKFEGFADENSNYLSSLDFIAGLGKTEESTIDIEELKWFDKNGVQIEYDTEISSGSFRLLGVCYEGGARLINPIGQAAQILSISPNPAENWLDLEVSLIEKGATEISIFNINGEKVKTLLSEEIETIGTFNLSSDLKNISSGQYYIILKTPTYIETNQLMIVK